MSDAGKMITISVDTVRPKGLISTDSQITIIPDAGLTISGQGTITISGVFDNDLSLLESDSVKVPIRIGTFATRSKINRDTIHEIETVKETFFGIDIKESRVRTSYNIETTLVKGIALIFNRYGNLKTVNAYEETIIQESDQGGFYNESTRHTYAWGETIPNQNIIHFMPSKWYKKYNHNRK